MTTPETPAAGEKCAVCGLPVAPEDVTLLDIPLAATRIRLCPTDAAHAMRVGGGVAKFLGDLGVRPDAVKRTMDGARAMQQLVAAFRGPAK